MDHVFRPKPAAPERPLSFANLSTEERAAWEQAFKWDLDIHESSARLDAITDEATLAEIRAFALTAWFEESGGDMEKAKKDRTVEDRVYDRMNTFMQTKVSLEAA